MYLGAKHQIKRRISMNFSINNRNIGKDNPPYIIAELSGNHNGQLERALELVDAAASTGADAVKLQTYTADTITINSDRPEFKIHGGLWDGRSLYDLYQEASTPWEWHEEIFKRAREHGLDVFSSPFDPTAVDFLEALDVPAYKIASFEIVDIPLIAKVAATNKPIIMSTGVANYGEIEKACAAASASAGGYSILHCVSAYPTEPKDMNLRTMNALHEAFGAPVGLSDHSLGSAVAVAAVVSGASIVEKHLTLKRSDGGPDAGFSLEPHEFKRMVEDCHIAHSALGNVKYNRKGIGGGNAQFRRSLYVVQDIKKGEAFSEANLRSIRPGLGLDPEHLFTINGKCAQKDIKAGTPLEWSMVTQ